MLVHLKVQTSSEAYLLPQQAMPFFRERYLKRLLRGVPLPSRRSSLSFPIQVTQLTGAAHRPVFPPVESVIMFYKSSGDEVDYGTSGG